jgi:hypothetical protein
MATTSHNTTLENDTHAVQLLDYPVAMDQHSVTVQVAGDADALWALLGDMANISWMPPTRRVDCDGVGPGMRRRIYGSTDTPVVERWIRIDADRREIVYQLEENNPLPADPYIVTATVENSDSGGSQVRWVVDFESDDRDKVIQGIDIIYTMIAKWLEDAVAAG